MMWRRFLTWWREPCTYDADNPRPEGGLWPMTGVWT